MPKHIGIVGCSAEGASLCYRTICAESAERLGPHAHPEVSMHTPSLAEYVACLEAGDMEGVGDLMLDSARKLSAAGADFLICPDNTIHQAFDYVSKRSPLPWLHIAGTAAGEAAARGFSRVGITGTKWLTQSAVYPEKFEALGIEWRRPSPEAIDEVARIIMDELVLGRLEPKSTDYLLGVVADLKTDGCDAVVLGCTELPLVVDDRNSPLPVLDSTRLLARAALDTAIGS